MRKHLEQRLAIGRAHLPITGLDGYATRGDPTALAMIRSSLSALADGGPFTRWFDDEAVAAVAELGNETQFESAADLCRALCERIQSHSIHVAGIDDDLERFTARIAVHVQDRFGLTLPHLSESNPAYCRHFATTVSRAYAKVSRRIDRFANTAVIFVMGIPQCDFETPGGLHAWNWLVDFERGTVAAFDPQNERHGVNYANVSSLLYTLASARRRGDSVPGLRLLVRRHDSLHGGTVLFHLARHPIDHRSRWKIASRLRATKFDRVVPNWERELKAWDSVWPRSDRETPADDIVRFADE